MADPCDVCKYDMFLSWMLAHDFKNDYALEVRVFPEMGAGIVAPREHQMPLPGRDTFDYYLIIPPAILVCATKLRSTQSEIYADIEDEDHVLVLFFIIERLKGRQSKWYPYLDILKEDYYPIFD